MNPLTNVKNLQKLNQRELELGLTNKKSWHDQYKDSAWIFVGGLPYDLTEGDIVCVFSQYGEIVNINLVRDKKSGKSKGFCFLCYEDQKSTILAVDNFNGIKLLGRILRVDHVEEYKKPKEHGDEDEITMKLRTEGCAPQIPPSPEHDAEEEEEPLQVKVKVKKEKRVKKEKKVKKKKKKKAASKSSSSESDSDSETDFRQPKIKKEKLDPGYDRAINMQVRKTKRTHSPDANSDRSKYSKQERDEGDRRNGSEKSNYRDSERDRNRDFERDRNQDFEKGRNRDFERSRNSNYKRDSERDKNRDFERETDRKRDYREDFDRMGDKNSRGYDRKFSRDTREQRDGRYDSYSSKYDRKGERYGGSDQKRYNDRESRRDERR